MTRKDYVAIAAALKFERDGYSPNWDTNLFRAHTDACKAVSRAMAQDNPRFNRARFLTACGVPPEQV